MKRITAICICMALLISLAACGGTTNAPSQASPATQSALPDASASPAKPAEPAYSLSLVRIGSGNMTGGYYPIGNALAQLVNEKMSGIDGTNQAVPSDTDKLPMVDEGDIECAIIQNISSFLAYSGQLQFEGMKFDDVRAICNLSPAALHILCGKNSNIKSIEDFRGKKIACGTMGSGHEQGVIAVATAFGIDGSEFTKLYGDVAECYEMLKQGEADAMVHGTSLGASQCIDFMNGGYGYLLALDDEAIKSIMEYSTAYSALDIPAGIYKGIDQPVKTVANAAVLYCNKGLDENFVYDFVTSIFDNYEFLKPYSAYLKFTSLDTATDGLVFPLHPGAERYFKEKGKI